MVVSHVAAGSQRLVMNVAQEQEASFGSNSNRFLFIQIDFANALSLVDK